MTTTLAHQVELSSSYEETLERVIDALAKEGFGVLTRIDVKATLKEKLDADFRPYIILGACNPALAHRALQSEPLVGALLPCNLTVEQTGAGSLVSIVNPEAMMGFPQLLGNAEIRQVAAEAAERLGRVLDSLKT